MVKFAIGCALAVMLSATHAGAQQQYWWYYCRDAKLYYPYVQTCPGGWQKVDPHKVGGNGQINQPNAPTDATNSTFDQGQIDRREWETWFSSLKGDFSEGASYWAAHRTDRRTSSCDTSPPSTGADWTAGCHAARLKLLMSDLKRNTDPDYRRGWNSQSAAPPITQEPLPPVAQKTPEAAPTPSPALEQPPTPTPEQPIVAEAAPAQSPEPDGQATQNPTPSTSSSGSGVAVLIVIAVIIGAIAFGINRLKRARRNQEEMERQNRLMATYNSLMAKYHDAETVEKIMRGEVWQGMTKEMLLDARGSPTDSDEEVFKTKIRQTFKYNRTGRNRYGLRITIENGVVVGWQHSNQV